MTGHVDFDRALAGWFEAEALPPAPAKGLDTVISATRRRRPRPAWVADVGSHWVGEAPRAGSSSGLRSLPRLSLRWSTVLLLLLAIGVLVGGAIFVGSLLRQPPPPPGRLGHLAYGLNDDVYVAEWDGRNPIRVADAGPTDCSGFWGEGTMWSPDGRHFAYRSCRGTIIISDPQGRVVASFPGKGWGIAWSPDSSRVTTWVETYQTIGVYGIDGVRQALLPLPPGERAHGDYDPYWSPDGASIRIRLGGIWDIPLDGRSPRPIPADDPGSTWPVDSSPDGALIARAEGGSLIVMAADGSQARVLVPEGVSSVLNVTWIWSPTGDRIAFEVGRPELPPNEIRVVDLASGQVTSLATVRGVGMSHLLRWSPDGDRILFWNADASNVESLWTIRADGSDAQLLVPGSGWGDWQLLPAGS